MEETGAEQHSSTPHSPVDAQLTRGPFAQGCSAPRVWVSPPSRRPLPEPCPKDRSLLSLASLLPLLSPEDLGLLGYPQHLLSLAQGVQVLVNSWCVHKIPHDSVPAEPRC